MKEKYYAIRIGDPRYHAVYFMWRDDNSHTPMLFKTRKDAQAASNREGLDSTRKVVRVFLTTICPTQS